MGLFEATLNQAAFLFLLIVVGYMLAKWKFVPDNAHTVLSKLENYLFVPALVMGTFIDNFTVQTLGTAWKLLAGSFAVNLVMIAVSFPLARLLEKKPYERNVALFALCFSNFGFMGNAVVGALFPEMFMDYLLFTLPLWCLIYMWGVPVLLGDSGEKATLAQRLKNFVNPMFVSVILGMLIGILQIPVPGFIGTAIGAMGSCMSPVAMLLTGMTVAHFDLGAILKIKSVYWATFLRLLVYPAMFLAVSYFVPMPKTFALCAACALAMPVGLTPVIIPGAMGKDTKLASSMALVSHGLCCLTIPLVMLVAQWVIG